MYVWCPSVCVCGVGVEDMITISLEDCKLTVAGKYGQKFEILGRKYVKVIWIRLKERQLDRFGNRKRGE